MEASPAGGLLGALGFGAPDTPRSPNMSDTVVSCTPRRGRLRIGTAALAGVIASALGAGVATPAFAASTGSAAAVKPVTRLAGGDRIGTAIAISQATFS